MQIGPRIRVGGTLGKIGQQAKIGVGKLAQPIGQAVSLVNPALGTAISTAGDVLDTTDGKFSVGKAAKNAVFQYGVGKTGDLLRKIPGANRVLSPIQNLRDKLPEGVREAGTSVAHSVFGGSSGDEKLPPVQIGHDAQGNPIYNPGQGPDASSGQSGGGGFWNFLSKHKDDILDYGKAAEDIYGRYRRVKAEDKANKLAEQDYLARKPLRDASIAAFLDTSRPDLSSVFADPQNPTGRYRVVNVGSRV